MNHPAVQAPLLLAAVTFVAFVLHIGSGTVGLGAGMIAAFSRKGGHVHRTAGTVFFISMLVMATFAAYLAVVRPGQISNLSGAAFTAYLVGTAWLTVRRKEGAIGLAEKVGLVVALLFCIPAALLAYAVATGHAQAFKGPIFIAVCALSAITVLAAVTDAKVVLVGGISGAPRIARHLWRMCLGLLMATGSAFTNGLPRLLPGPMRVGPAFFLPILLPLALLVFWMIRVRLTSWPKRTLAFGG